MEEQLRQFDITQLQSEVKLMTRQININKDRCELIESFIVDRAKSREKSCSCSSNCGSAKFEVKIVL